MFPHYVDKKHNQDVIVFPAKHIYWSNLVAYKHNAEQTELAQQHINKHAVALCVKQTDN